MPDTTKRIVHKLFIHKRNLIALFFWSIPLLLSAFFYAVGFGLNRDLPRNFIENTATLIICISLSLLAGKKWSKYFQYFFFVLFSVYVLLESIYYYLFNANISASSIFILLETNLAEAREFVQFYFNPYILFILFASFILIVAFFIKKPIFQSNFNFRTKSLIFLLGVCMPLLLMLLKGYQRYNFYYLSFQSVVEYIEEQKKMASYAFDDHTATIPEFKYNTSIDTATYVLVIGESTTRKRLSLYGYERKTTPFLDSVKNELLIYDNVLSHHAYTIGSLKTTLTLNALTKKEDYSIVQLMNEAGFQTFWISNQRPIGEYESLVTKIALGSDNYITKNTALDGSITPYDEKLLPEFHKALHSAFPKKFIVLHPLGTHLLYKDRYPKSFEQFSGKSPANYSHEQALDKSNSYDNAVLYHDYFLGEVFKQLKALKHPTYLIYFSDHGEEVYESRDFSGHEEVNSTKAMYEVPFFIWMNSQFKDNFHENIYPSNPYSLKNFYHTLARLNQFQFKGYDSTKSIFHLQNNQSKRQLGNGNFYEDLP